MKAACLVSVWVSDGSSSVGEALKTTAVCVDCGFFVVNFVEMQKKGRSLGTLQGESLKEVCISGIFLRVANGEG